MNMRLSRREEEKNTKKGEKKRETYRNCNSTQF
jgi:hypothetical protein